MTTIPKISEQDIKRLCGEQSLERGRRYSSNSSLHDIRREGITLKARCRGSRATSYRLQVTFDANGLSQSRCSCPIGAGGRCKHIAALLLSWINHPAKFVERQPLEQALEPLSKVQLITLIKYLLRLEPDLEPMLASRLSSAEGEDASTDPAPYEQQAAMIFERSINREGTESDLAEELLAIRAIGDEMVASQNYQAAIAVYAGISKSVTEKLGEYQYFDNDGYVDNVVTDCVSGLIHGLQHEHNAESRRQAVEALIWVYIQDVSVLGGIGSISAEVPNMIGHLNSKDKQIAKRLLEEAIAKGDGEWADEEYRELLEAMDHSE